MVAQLLLNTCTVTTGDVNPVKFNALLAGVTVTALQSPVVGGGGGGGVEEEPVKKIGVPVNAILVGEIVDVFCVFEKSQSRFVN